MITIFGGALLNSRLVLGMVMDIPFFKSKKEGCFVLHFLWPCDLRMVNCLKLWAILEPASVIVVVLKNTF